jgi:Ser/Thr protein kinase RdoA (MazF antagonist)
VISSEEFAGLGQDEQIGRLLGLGRIALCEFGVEPQEISPLVHAENTTFKVSSPQGVFNLRISRPGYQSTSNIRSELLFLDALSKAGFRVPRPWQGRLVTASSGGVPEPRDCVLLGWQEGDFARGKLTVERAWKVGRTIARLHEFTSTWSPPDGFDRQQLHGWAFAPREPMPIDSPTSMCHEEDRILLVQVEKEARALLSGLPRDPQWLGLIHSDLHLGNVLFEGDEVNLIDFDDTGFGFWIYDFAAALAYVSDAADFSGLREAMFDGYREVRELPIGVEELLGPFIQLRLGGIAGWIIGRADNPRFREEGAAYVNTLCNRIRHVRSNSNS